MLFIAVARNGMENGEQPDGHRGEVGGDWRYDSSFIRGAGIME